MPNFELNVSPKTEPGLLPLGSVSIANIDILAKVLEISDLKTIFVLNLQSEPPAPVPLPLDLIAQHCTLLPPDMVWFQDYYHVTSCQYSLSTKLIIFPPVNI